MRLQANAPAMNLHLAEISTLVTPGAQAVITLDGAGRHRLGRRLVVASNIGLYQPTVDACCDAWNALLAMPERIRTITSGVWTSTVNA